MHDLLEEIYGTIMRNKLRTALTGFAVAWGIFMLIVLLGAGNGLLNAFENQSADMKMNTMKVYPGFTTKAYNGLNAGRFIALNPVDVDITRRSFPGQVSDLGATNSIETTLTHGMESVSLTVNGVYPNFSEMEAMHMEEGRFINRRDLEERRKVVVLHRKTADILFPNGNAVGQLLHANSVIYKVVGVYLDQNRFSPSAYVPFSTLQLIYNKGDEVGNILFSTRGLTNEADNEAFENRYRAAIALHHGFDPTDDGAIWIWNRFTQYLQQLQATRTLHISIWVIGIFTLLSGIVGVSNIMLITVRERTHEFGIRKALGAKPASILWLIITESVAITTFFGYLGMVAGVAATEYMNIVGGKQVMDAGFFSMTFFENPTVDISITIEATLTLIVAGTLAGLFPALKATRIRPIEALRAD